MGDTTEACSNCSHDLSAGDSTCPECGQPVAEQTPTPATPPKKRVRWAVLVAGLVVLALIAGGAAWYFTQSSSQDTQQYDTSAAALMTMLTDMSTVTSTQMVRDVATEAQPQIETIDATLQQQPKPENSGQLNTMREAFASLGALTEYTQADTAVWTQTRGPLEDSLNQLSAYGGSTADASAKGAGAVKALDDLTRRIDQAMNKYRKELEQFRSAARAVRYDLDSYFGQMDPLVNRDAELHKQTRAYVQRLRTKDVFMFEAIDYFSAVAAERRDIVNQMTGVYAPGDLYDVNLNLVTASTAGADASDNAVSELQDNDCTYGACYFDWDPSWRPILLGSPEVNTAYRKALAEWQAAILTAAQQATGQELPKKPNL